MADVQTNFKYTIDLNAGENTVVMQKSLLQGDKNAHKIIITAVRGITPVDLTGAAVSGFYINKDGQTSILSGTTENGAAVLVLDESCYAVVGRFNLVIKLMGADVINGVLRLIGNVNRTRTDVVIDPNDVIPSLDELLQQIAAMERATSAANQAAESANAKAAEASSATRAANTAANTANTAASNASAKAAEAGRAASAANSAADNANTKAAAADTATQGANAAATAATNAAGSANSAATAANQAAESANAKATEANAATGKANTAADKANTAANRLSGVALDVTMLPPSAEPTASVTQTDTKTTFSMGIPASNLAYATFEVNDSMNLIMHSPERFSDIAFALNNGNLEVQI